MKFSRLFLLSVFPKKKFEGALSSIAPEIKETEERIKQVLKVLGK